jgi:hypothetical protein
MLAQKQENVNREMRKGEYKKLQIMSKIDRDSSKSKHLLNQRNEILNARLSARDNANK